MNVSRIRLGLMVSLVALSSPGFAGECTPTVHDGWVRMPPMAMPMMAGFGRIENRCANAVTIVAASSAAFGEVSLHETRLIDGVSRMRMLQKLRIGAGESAVLQPGGMHLMLMQPGVALRPGGKVLIEFVLKDGNKLRGEFVIRSAGE